MAVLARRCFDQGSCSPSGTASGSAWHFGWLLLHGERGTVSRDPPVRSKLSIARPGFAFASTDRTDRRAADGRVDHSCLGAGCVQLGLELLRPPAPLRTLGRPTSG